MSCLPRQPRGPEVVIELRFLVAANYKLGGCSGTSGTGVSSVNASDVAFTEFLPGSECCNGEAFTATPNAATEGFREGDTKDLPSPRLFLGM